MGDEDGGGSSGDGSGDGGRRDGGGDGRVGAPPIEEQAGCGPRVTPGIEPGTVLKDAPDNWSTSADDQVVEGLVFHSIIKIRHLRVHFKNCKWLVTPSGQHWAYDPALTDEPQAKDMVFEHCDFADALPTFGSPDPQHPMIVRTSISRGTSDGYGDSSKAGSNFIAEDCVFQYDHTPSAEAHTDGMQSDVGAVSHIVVRYSTFVVADEPDGIANAALLQNEVSGDVQDWLIHNNKIHAFSAYAIRARNITGPGRITIRNNCIDRVWIYGPLDTTQNDKLVDFTDNVDENGKPIEF